MKVSNKIIVMFSVISLIVFASILFLSKNKKKKIINEDKINVVEIEERSVFFEATQKFPKQKSSSKYIACISPHHLLAADLMAESMSIALNQESETIILVGPNHNELGDSKMISSTYSWQTDLGKVEGDIQVVNKLKQNDFLKLDNEVVKKDHSIFNLIPFIKHYSPNSKIVPILMSRKVNLKDIEKLSEFLINNVKKDFLIISSIDFSHYLSADVAAEKDKETLSLIEDNYLEKIFSLTNDNLDCPSCLVLPILISNKQDGGKIKVLKNTNSGFLTNNYNSETTSYITVVFPAHDKGTYYPPLKKYE